MTRHYQLRRCSQAHAPRHCRPARRRHHRPLVHVLRNLCPDPLQLRHLAVRVLRHLRPHLRRHHHPWARVPQHLRPPRQRHRHLSAPTHSGSPDGPRAAPPPIDPRTAPPPPGPRTALAPPPPRIHTAASASPKRRGVQRQCGRQQETQTEQGYPLHESLPFTSGPPWLHSPSIPLDSHPAATSRTAGGPNCASEGNIGRRGGPAA